MTRNFDYDLFVIGAGSGGVRAARVAAKHGAKVAVAEEYRVGGTCVIRGCVPKKLLVYAAHFREDFEDAAGFGWTVDGARFDWARLIANKDAEIKRLEGVYERLLQDAGVTAIRGHARLLDAHRVEIGTDVFRAETILIATGGRPVFPPGHGWDQAISSNEAFHLTALPRRVAVYGGGYIAVEFASIFNGMGAQVTQIYRGAQILRGFDDDVRDTLAGELVKKGIDLRVETTIDRIDKNGPALRLHLSGGETVDVDAVMAATGRRPNTENLGLATAGVTVGKGGEIAVDAYSRTTQANIYAIGDVTDRLALTPVAIQEAMAFVDTVYRGTPRA
ncbi:MAG: FAD-dependent oxidoreductase, partial [Methylocella sp.]